MGVILYRIFTNSIFRFKEKDDDNDLHYKNANKRSIRKGLLNAGCTELISPKYSLLYNNSDYALVMTGTLSIDLSTPKWPGMSEYYLATGGRWGVVNMTHNQIIPITYSWVDFTVHKNLFLVNNVAPCIILKRLTEMDFRGYKVANGV